MQIFPTLTDLDVSLLDTNECSADDQASLFHCVRGMVALGDPHIVDPSTHMLVKSCRQAKHSGRGVVPAAPGGLGMQQSVIGVWVVSAFLLMLHCVTSAHIARRFVQSAKPTAAFMSGRHLRIAPAQRPSKLCRLHMTARTLERGVDVQKRVSCAVPEPQHRVRLHYTEVNERGEEALPLIVLHGLLGQGRNFRSWAASLHDRLQRLRRIVLPDLRNHGSSPHTPAEHMTYPEMAKDVLQLMDELGMERAVVCGHSMGGKVAASLALAHPERVAGLVVMDIAPVTYSVTDGTNWSQTHQVIEALNNLPLEGLKNRAQADGALRDLGLEDPGMRAFALTNLVVDPRTEGMRWQINLPGLRTSLAQIAGFELAGQRPLGRYPHKTLFLNGSKSKYLRSTHLPTIAQMFEKFSLATIRNAGHWVHADAPEDTIGIVRRYLDEELDV